MKKRLFGASAGIIAVILVFGLVSFLLTPYAKTYSAEHVSQSKKQIALTFDDGPGKHTQQLLDGLRERNVKASFFLMGSKVEKRPEIVKTMHDDGHLIGCHTWSHISFFEHTDEEIAEEIDRTNKLIESITGEYPRFLRPPYGYYTGALLCERVDRAQNCRNSSVLGVVQEDYISVARMVEKPVVDILLVDMHPVARRGRP